MNDKKEDSQGIAEALDLLLAAVSRLEKKMEKVGRRRRGGRDEADNKKGGRFLRKDGRLRPKIKRKFKRYICWAKYKRGYDFPKKIGGAQRRSALIKGDHVIWLEPDRPDHPEWTLCHGQVASVGEWLVDADLVIKRFNETDLRVNERGFLRNRPVYVVPRPIADYSAAWREEYERNKTCTPEDPDYMQRMKRLERLLVSPWLTIEDHDERGGSNEKS